jgi:hypothetical protein
MSETGDLSDPEIQIFSEESVAVSVVGTVGGVCDFLQGFVYSKAVFKLTSVREVYRVLIEECALEFFTELVMFVILNGSSTNISGVGIGESFLSSRVVGRRDTGSCILFFF